MNGGAGLDLQRLTGQRLTHLTRPFLEGRLFVAAWRAASDDDRFAELLLLGAHARAEPVSRNAIISETIENCLHRLAGFERKTAIE